MVGNLNHAPTDHFLLGLYANASSLKPTDFQHTTLQRLQQILPFNYAAWGGGLVANRTVTDVVMLDRTDYGLPLPLLATNDAYCDRLLENPGRSVMFDDVPDYRKSVAYRELWRQHKSEHVLSTVVMEPIAGYLSFLCLGNVDAQRRFNEHERQIKQNLMPHLANALRLNRLMATTLFAEQGESVAIVNAEVGILSSQLHFDELLRNELGCRYEVRLRRMLPNKGTRGRWRGDSLQLLFEPLGDNFLMRARNRAPLDHLSPREQEVAELFSNGLSYREVAKALHMAPNTSRTHIHRIYEKLGVSSKVKLVQLMNASCA